MAPATARAAFVGLPIGQSAVSFLTLYSHFQDIPVAPFGMRSAASLYALVDRWLEVKPMANSFGTIRGNVQRRIEAVAARLEAFNARARGLLRDTVEEERDDSERIRHLEVIESKLEALEERLKRLEDEMRSKESPPETFGTERGFSTGMHLPGLG
jgi:hypothetical protein